MVAIAILSVSLVSAFAAVQSSLQTTKFSQDRIAAYYLVQDAAEYVRNLRDENLIKGYDAAVKGSSWDWLSGISAQASDPCYFGKTCQVDVPAATLSSCSGSWNSCNYLRQDTSTGLFGYTSAWKTTVFKRELQFSQVSATEIKMTISISWTAGPLSRNLKVEQSLFNRI